MIDDTYVAVLAIAFGLALGWAIIGLLNSTSRRFRRGYQALKCKCGFHEPSGHYEAAIGGRDVMRCLYCDHVVYEVQRTKESLRRVK